MSDKDVILNNLHHVVGDAEWEMVNRIIKTPCYSGEVSKELELPEKHVLIKVTIEIWELEEPL
jgi:hypothetical protein